MLPVQQEAVRHAYQLCFGLNGGAETLQCLATEEKRQELPGVEEYCMHSGARVASFLACFLYVLTVVAGGSCLNQRQNNRVWQRQWAASRQIRSHQCRCSLKDDAPKLRQARPQVRQSLLLRLRLSPSVLLLLMLPVRLLRLIDPCHCRLQACCARSTRTTSGRWSLLLSRQDRTKETEETADTYKQETHDKASEDVAAGLVIQN